jgi:hypothetical protein
MFEGEKTIGKPTLLLATGSIRKKLIGKVWHGTTKVL